MRVPLSRGSMRAQCPLPEASFMALLFSILISLFILISSLAPLWVSYPCSPPSFLDGSSLMQPQQYRELQWNGDLRQLQVPWNRLCFGPPPGTLRIALFVKKWPVARVPGGLERHALTLHKVLALRGHVVHVYTISGDGSIPKDLTEGGLTVHFLKPTPRRTLDHRQAWEAFRKENSSLRFDIVHSESVALPHGIARGIRNLAASWHGINYEVLISDVVQDLLRKPDDPPDASHERALTERLTRLVDEIRFFHSYRHHVATSDYVGDVLRTIYELPAENVHIILNGVDEHIFHPDPLKGSAFRDRYGVPQNATLVLGAAGRLVRDKGHPLLFEAFSEVLKDRKDVYLLVAGSGPWAERYKELAPNVLVLGPMTPLKLAEFYNAIDIFVNPTLRAQGLDHTLLEAMQCGKALLATEFWSITWSVIITDEFGYTFSPNVPSLLRALRRVIQDGKETMKRKGRSCLEYASLMFNATKMGASYERLFLCIKDERYCHYPLSTDCPIESQKNFREMVTKASRVASSSGSLPQKPQNNEIVDI